MALLAPVLFVGHLELLLMNGCSFGGEFGFHRFEFRLALGLGLDSLGMLLFLGLGRNHGMDSEDEEDAE